MQNIYTLRRDYLNVILFIVKVVKLNTFYPGNKFRRFLHIDAKILCCVTYNKHIINNTRSTNYVRRGNLSDLDVQGYVQSQFSSYRYIGLLANHLGGVEVTASNY